MAYLQMQNRQRFTLFVRLTLAITWPQTVSTSRDYLAVAAQVHGDVRPRVWLVHRELWATYSQRRRSVPILRQACLIGSELENVQALGSLKAAFGSRVFQLLSRYSLLR